MYKLRWYCWTLLKSTYSGWFTVVSVAEWFCRLHTVQEAAAFRAEVLREDACERRCNSAVFNQRERFHRRVLAQGGKKQRLLFPVIIEDHPEPEQQSSSDGQVLAR